MVLKVIPDETLRPYCIYSCYSVFCRGEDVWVGLNRSLATGCDWMWWNGKVFTNPNWESSLNCDVDKRCAQLDEGILLQIIECDKQYGFFCQSMEITTEVMPAVTTLIRTTDPGTNNIIQHSIKLIHSKSFTITDNVTLFSNAYISTPMTDAATITDPTTSTLITDPVTTTDPDTPTLSIDPVVTTHPDTSSPSTESKSTSFTAMAYIEVNRIVTTTFGPDGLTKVYNDNTTAINSPTFMMNHSNSPYSISPAQSSQSINYSVQTQNQHTTSQIPSSSSDRYSYRWL